MMKHRSIFLYVLLAEAQYLIDAKKKRPIGRKG
jgi:hypothetical protein